MSDYTLTFPAFIGLLGIGAWFLVQRQIKKSDDESNRAAQAVEARFKDHEVRMNQHGDRLREAELKLAEKINREELEKVSDKMMASVEGLRGEFKADLVTAQNVILAAVGRHGG